MGVVFGIVSGVVVFGAVFYVSCFILNVAGISNPHKMIIAVAIGFTIALSLAVEVGRGYPFFGYREEPQAGQASSVVYDPVNFRKDPKGEILFQLDKGSVVSKTGRLYDYFGDGPFLRWEEVEVISTPDGKHEGAVGWVVTEALS